MTDLRKEEVIHLQTEFSTADAEYPTFSKEGGVLTVCYEDWQERQVEIQFGEVISFKWQECESYSPNERDDACHEILHSMWLQEHLDQCIVTEREGHRHYRFNFNGNGQLEVICLGFVHSIRSR